MSRTVEGSRARVRRLLPPRKPRLHLVEVDDGCAVGGTGLRPGHEPVAGELLPHGGADRAGAAAVHDPDEPEAIAAGIRRALAERDALVERGRAHAARFSWRENGRVHLEAFREAA